MVKFGSSPPKNELFSQELLLLTITNIKPGFEIANL